MRVRELYGHFFCSWPGLKQGVINADITGGGGGGSTRQIFGYR